MTANTETLTRPDESAGREATSPPETDPPSTSRRAVIGWIAVLLAAIAVAVLVFATFTGGDDSEVPAIPFDPQVEQWEREAHLEGNARTHGTGADTGGEPASTDEVVPGSRHMPL
jgi:hypothetical protein